MKNHTDTLSTRTMRRRRGFTILETVVSLGILMGIGIAFTSLYMNMLTTSARVSAVAYTAWDNGNAVDRITIALREARRFEFMDNGTSGPTAYQTPANPGNNPNYFTTLAGGVTVVTGIHIVFPASLSSVTLSMPTSTGFSNTNMNGSNNLVDYRTDGAYLDIYRSDAQGHPAPTSGTYLWMRGTLNGVTVPTDANADTANGIDGQPLADDIASWSGAVQFVQGQTNEVQIKVVTGAFDRSNGQVTSDSVKGSVTTLTAEHVYLRNHDPNGVTSSSAHGKTQYSGS